MGHVVESWVGGPHARLSVFQEEFAPWNKHGSYSSIGNSSGSSTRDSRLEVDSTTSDSSFSNLGLDQYGNWVPAAAAAGRRPDITAITRQLRELSAGAEPAGGRPESGFVSLQSLQSSGSGAGRAPAAASPQASPRPPAGPAAGAPSASAGGSDSGGGGEHTVTLSVPPALPPKRRSQRGPPLGHYDNVPAGGVSASCSLDGVVLRHRPRHWHDADDSRPPPLPMKKKHGTHCTLSTAPGSVVGCGLRPLDVAAHCAL